jgi:hypothetical protein
MPGFALAAERECKADFEALVQYYSPFGLVASISKARPLLRHAHRVAYCFRQLAHGVGARQEHQRIYLQELVSDSLHLLHVLFVGDKRAAQFYLRSLVENFWRHSYYQTHSVEYGWIHNRAGFFLTIESLRDFCRNTPLACGPLKPRFGNLANYFSQLSSSVHSTTAPSLVLRNSAKAIILSSEDVKAMNAILPKLLDDLLLILSVQEVELFNAMSSANRAFMLGAFDKPRKKQRQTALGA